MDATEQVAKFGEFFETLYYKDLLTAVSKGHKHLSVPFPELARFSVDLAEDLLEDPENVLGAARHTVEQMDLGGDTKGFEARFSDLPKTSHLMVRNIRSKHIGKLLQLEGIVRQKSDVRPQVTSARFECPSCGNIIPILQLDEKFREPHLCASCGRKGQFRLIHKELVDAQKIVLEEATEDMDGGEQPKRLNIFLRNDLVSPLSDKKTNPGSRIRITGVIKEIPIVLATGGKSTRFDLLCECNHVEPVQEEFTNLVMTDEEIEEIKEFSKDPNLFDLLTRSLAPTIFGHDKIKEALLLQLMGGVKKVSEDGVSRRGDIHVLLIGDPGSGKCSRGDTKIMLADGTITTIASIVQERNGVGDGLFVAPFSLPSLQLGGAMGSQEAVRVWQRPEESLLRICLRSGKVLHVTKEHPLFCSQNGFVMARPAKEFRQGSFVATPRAVKINGLLQSLQAPQHVPRQKRYRTPSTLETPLARLMGYLCGDGYLALSQTSAWLSFTNDDAEVLNDYATVFKHCFGEAPTLRASHVGKSAQELYVLSKMLYSFFMRNAPELCNPSAKKTVPLIVQRSPDLVLAGFLQGLFEADAYVNDCKSVIEYSTTSRELAEQVQLLLLRFGVVSFVKEKLKCAKNSVQKRPIRSYDVLIPPAFALQFAANVGFFSSRKNAALERLLQRPRNTNVDIIPNVRSFLFLLRRRLGLSQSQMGLPRPTYMHYERGDRLPSVESLRSIAMHLAHACPDDEEVAVLEQLAFADIFWDQVVSVEEVKHKNDVYDLEVTQTHNYVANGVIIHNSQLVKRIGVVAPKSRFVSGKGASGAGLTATVVKDEFMRGWALEAGTLVLANKGIACIDEMDKMSDEDTSAMHEALEQQTVSISKANIQATLRCETTVLAAANPKLGRFDPYDLIAKQIDMPDTLINRFDLIFPVKDLPDPTRDDQMASFILELHRSGKGDTAKDLKSTEFLRKYIAYAKQNVKPELTDKALEEIKRYYVQMRSQGGGEGGVSAIPISARQLEALVRLAEASARARLSLKVTEMDARRAIELVHECLSQIGLDPETGKFDIDRITTGITAKQRSDIGLVKEVIADLERAIGKIIPEQDIVRESEIKGVSEQKAMEILTKLTRQGDLFMPKNGFYSKVR